MGIWSTYSHSSLTGPVVSGDFNEYLAARKCQMRGLLPLIPPNTPTHNKGNHLDQVFSNLELIELA